MILFSWVLCVPSAYWHGENTSIWILFLLFLTLSWDIVLDKTGLSAGKWETHCVDETTDSIFQSRLDCPSYRDYRATARHTAAVLWHPVRENLSQVCPCSNLPAKVPGNCSSPKWHRISMERLFNILTLLQVAIFFGSSKSKTQCKDSFRHGLESSLGTGAGTKISAHRVWFSCLPTPTAFSLMALGSVCS